MGLFDKGGLLDKGLGVIDQLVIDEDKKNELRYALYMKYADVMFSRCKCGMGDSVYIFDRGQCGSCDRSSGCM